MNRADNNQNRQHMFIGPEFVLGLGLVGLALKSLIDFLF